MRRVMRRVSEGFVRVDDAAETGTVAMTSSRSIIS